MLRVMRYSKLVTGGLLLLAVAITLCPHAVHKNASVLHNSFGCDDSVDNEAMALVDIETAPVHDSDHCVFDVSHSHDFRLTVVQNGDLAPLLTSAVQTNDLQPVQHFTSLSIHYDSGLFSSSPLAQLHVIRLLV